MVLLMATRWFRLRQTQTSWAHCCFVCLYKCHLVIKNESFGWDDLMVLSLTLPTSTNGNFGCDIFCRVQRPIVNNFRIVLLIGPLFSVHDKIDHRKIDIDSIMMPLVITNLGQFPAPFGGSESIFLALLVFFP